MDTTSKAKVLIVDDDARTLRLVARVLASCDVPCVTAGSAGEALELLATAPGIDVVLSDIYMPATDGLEFLATVRKRHADRPWLQFLLITGQASVATAVAAMRLEASDYLLKPVEPKALRESVEHALARARSIREVQSTQRDSPDGAMLRQLADTAQALVAELRRGSPNAADADSALRTLNLLQRMADARSSVFGNAVMPEPAWEMLAELMSARLSGRHLSVTSLALASKSPMTTALRRIEDLIQGGLATRLADPEDRRRTYIELTPEGEMRMQLFLEGFSRIARGSA
jgi:CheY-like chemotaxis protein/DNA-binding MarR family transcriptional regulator